MPQLSELATLFAPYETGTKVPTTGIAVNGVDLADLLAPATLGAATVSPTGITVGSADIATLFAAFGTTTKLSNEFAGYYTDFAMGKGAQTAKAGVKFDIAGLYSGNRRSGRYLGEGLDSSLYEIKIEFVSGAALSYNNATAFSALTGTRECYLQITSNAGEATESTVANIIIREIADPANKVEGLVTLTATAESWGSLPYPPQPQRLPSYSIQLR